MLVYPQVVMIKIPLRKIRVISVFPTTQRCPADPSRLGVAQLNEVWACPAAVALRGRLHLEETGCNVQIYVEKDRKVVYIQITDR